jgi:hypothetical protein
VSPLPPAKETKLDRLAGELSSRGTPLPQPSVIKARRSPHCPNLASMMKR